MSSEQDLPSVLSMEVDVENEDESEYRLLVNKHVKYLKVAPNTFERDVLSFPLESLPPLPFSDPSWKVAQIFRQPGSSKLNVVLSYRNLAAVQNVWHSIRVDVLDLDKVVQLTAAAFEAMLPTSTIISSASASHSSSREVRVIAKIARFEWEIPRIERETRAYQILEQQQVASGITPRFLGHLHEHGRVMGFIIEKMDDRQHASLNHLEACEMALAEFHKFGLHGDVNRHNFLVGQDGEVTLLDFERFEEDATADSKAKEMQSLRSELTDNSGRGGGFRSGDFVD
ncbi:uncharacterized protein RHO25_000312 [Cercospora beticola]|nr:hypothetical protein RHO25_000312 [Cercospora beticola]CAK1356045.1 unnamed protein product [Cercospora beticola]